jgi:hypothetical protein
MIQCSDSSIGTVLLRLDDTEVRYVNIFFIESWYTTTTHVFNLIFGSISEKGLRIVHITICFIGITR